MSTKDVPSPLSTRSMVNPAEALPRETAGARQAPRWARILVTLKKCVHNRQCATGRLGDKCVVELRQFRRSMLRSRQQPP